VISKPLKKMEPELGRSVPRIKRNIGFTAPGKAHDHQTLLRLTLSEKAVEDFVFLQMHAHVA